MTIVMMSIKDNFKTVKDCYQKNESKKKKNAVLTTLSVSMSEYELKRQKQIQENKEVMATMGLLDAKDNLKFIVNHEQDKRKVKKTTYRGRTKENEVVPVERRMSKRMRGEMPDINTESSQWTLDQIEEGERSVLRSSEEKEGEGEEDLKLKASLQRYSFCLWMGRKQTTNYDVVVKLPNHIAVPLTLCSIGTTVWNLGQLYTGKEKKKFWSNHCCLFRHPYPIGFKATKSHFDHNYTMTILKGENGPIFELTQENGPTWTGHTPTQPWTQACLKSKSPGTRVSGPLFYGFSDPLIQYLIEHLPGYEKWEDNTINSQP